MREINSKVRRKYERHDIVPKTNTSIAKPEESRLSSVAKGFKTIGRGYVNALNDPDIQNAMSRLYRSNMWNLTGEDQYKD